MTLNADQNPKRRPTNKNEKSYGKDEVLAHSKRISLTDL
jgi:hypothetical protein